LANKKIRRGAPSKYSEKFTPKMAGWLARDGATNDEIAAKLEISTVTLYDWIKKYPELSNAIKKGKEVVDREVEDSLLKRALGYDYEKVETEVSIFGEKEFKKKKVTQMHNPADATSMIFWLCNRKPGQWRRNPTFVDFEKAKGEITELFDKMKSTSST
jgi:transposase-like protein